MAHLSETRSRTRRNLCVKVARDVVAGLVTAPVVVPIWWGLWKVCDALWGRK